MRNTGSRRLGGTCARRSKSSPVGSHAVGAHRPGQSNTNLTPPMDLQNDGCPLVCLLNPPPNGCPKKTHSRSLTLLDLYKTFRGDHAQVLRGARQSNICPTQAQCVRNCTGKPYQCMSFIYRSTGQPTTATVLIRMRSNQYLLVAWHLAVQCNNYSGDISLKRVAPPASTLSSS